MFTGEVMRDKIAKPSVPHVNAFVVTDIKDIIMTMSEQEKSIAERTKMVKSVRAKCLSISQYLDHRT